MTALTPQPGADPGLPCITRRRLLAASPVLLVASTLAGDAVAGPGAALEAPDVADALPTSPRPDTPVLALYKRWKAEMEFLDGPVGRQLPEKEFDARVDAVTEWQDEMDTLPACDMTDLAAKVTMLSDFGDFALPKGIIAECDAILAEVPS